MMILIMIMSNSLILQKGDFREKPDLIKEMKYGNSVNDGETY
jgi:hypothetical protein